MESILLLFVVMVMAVFLVSRLQQRYHNAGGGTDTRNLEKYGHPVKSLYTSTEVFTLHHRIEITDDSNRVVYRAETQFPSIHDKTDIYRADGGHVAHIEKKLFSLHEIRYVEMDNGMSFQLSNELFHHMTIGNIPFRSVIEIAADYGEQVYVDPNDPTNMKILGIDGKTQTYHVYSLVRA